MYELKNTIIFILHNKIILNFLLRVNNKIVSAN